MLSANNDKRRDMLSPEEELLSDKDLREASIEQLINLRYRIALELQKREGMPPQHQTDVIDEPTDPADPNADQPRTGE